MSIKKWQEIAEQKQVVEEQRKNILNAFKERKVKDEMGGLAAEKLFRPITKKLYPPEHKIPERKDFYENFDRDLFEEDDIADEMGNLFGNDQEFLPQDQGVSQKFKKNIPLPPEEDIDLEEDEGAAAPEKSLLPESDDEVFPGEKQRRHSAPILTEPPAYSPPPSYKFHKKDPESVDLATLERFLKNNKGDPNAKITTQKSKFYGWDKTQVEDKIFRIYSERAKKVLQKKSIGQKLIHQTKILKSFSPCFLMAPFSEL